MCNKTPFPSRREANHAIKTIKRSRLDKTKRPRRAYKCEECGQFHLTSKHLIKKRKRRNAARTADADENYIKQDRVNRRQIKHKII